MFKHTFTKVQIKKPYTVQNLLKSDVDVPRVNTPKPTEKYEYVPLAKDLENKLVFFATMKNENASQIRVFRLDYADRSDIKITNWTIDISEMTS